jgi:hypothetical protein
MRITSCSRTTLERCATAYLFILPFGTIGDICRRAAPQTGGSTVIALLSPRPLLPRVPLPYAARRALLPAHFAVVCFLAVLSYALYTGLGPDATPAQRLPLFYVLPHAPAWGIDRVAIARDLALQAEEHPQVRMTCYSYLIGRRSVSQGGRVRMHEAESDTAGLPAHSTRS